MTEWDAKQYDRIDALQKWHAENCLSRLELKGSERILDIGCGNGRISAEVARRLSSGSLVGIDRSSQMVAFARHQHPQREQTNLAFEIGEATTLSYCDEFDLIISFNTLHWVHNQRAALRGMKAALKAPGRALLLLVPDGPQKGIEYVMEETGLSDDWVRYFENYERPIALFTPEEFRALAIEAGFHVERIDRKLYPWDFESRQKLAAWVEAVFIEWVQRVPAGEQATFVSDVLERYRRIDGLRGESPSLLKFYQMEVVLRTEPQ